MGKLGMEIGGWQEPAREGMVEVDGVRYKPVEIKTVVSNVSQEPVDIQTLDWKTDQALFQFDLQTLDRQMRGGILAEIWQDIIDVGELNRSNKEFFLPPGLGLPITIYNEVPPNVTDYQLKVEGFSRAAPAPKNVILKGKEVEIPFLIDPSFKIKNANEVWEYPNMSFGFLGTYIEQQGTVQVQRVQISITNRTNEVFNIRGAKLLVYLQDGRVVYGDLEEYYGNIEYSEWIRPQEVGSFPIAIGFDDASYEDRSGFEIFDLSGSVAVLTVGPPYSLGMPVWGAWKVP